MTNYSSSRNNSEEWIGALANFSIQYNLGVIAPALLLLDPSRAFRLDDPTTKTYFSAYPRSDDADSLLKSAVFIGAIVGQCVMGLVGDLLGSLEIAMVLTNVLTVVGVVGCTIAPIVGGTNSDSVYFFLAIARFILGIGVGGKYPLASAMRAAAAEIHKNKNNHNTMEDDHNDYKSMEHRAKEVARAFFWQTPGAIVPYVISAILLWIVGEPMEGNLRPVQFQYVILVGIGTIPSLVVLVELSRKLLYEHSLSIPPTSTNDAQQGEDQGRRIAKKTTGNAILMSWNRLCRSLSKRKGYSNIPSPQKHQNRHMHQNNNDANPLMTALRTKSCWKKLAGTGLTWALYDFIYYGTAFNLPEIFSHILGGSKGLITDAWHNALIASMGLPGVVLAIRMMEPMGGPKNLQIWGFVAIGMGCVAMIFSYQDSGNGNSSVFQLWMAILSCSFLLFTLNWGCNVSTYVLPSEVFPPSVRSTFHGWSAGMGKCGAALGSLLFTKLNAISIVLTFTVCICCCVLGVVISYYWIEDETTRFRTSSAPQSLPGTKVSFITIIKNNLIVNEKELIPLSNSSDAPL